MPNPGGATYSHCAGKDGGIERKSKVMTARSIGGRSAPRGTIVATGSNILRILFLAFWTVEESKINPAGAGNVIGVYSDVESGLVEACRGRKRWKYQRRIQIFASAEPER